MANRKIKIQVVLEIEVDPRTWAKNRDLLDPTGGYQLFRIYEDVNNAFQNLALDSNLVEEMEATVNGIRPDPSLPTLPPALVRQDDGTYVRVEDGLRSPAAISQTMTERFSYACNDGEILVTEDDDVFRLDYQGNYFQKQGPCDCHFGSCDCVQTGREVVNRYDIEVGGDYTTMITCPDCTERMEQSI